MSLSLADLKKSKASRLDNLIKSTEKAESQSDNRFWQPTVDKAGNGSALIRFLPASPQDGLDALPWTKYFEHAFKGPSNRWYIEKSRTSLGQNEKDPVAEYNTKLWKTEDTELREQVRRQKRKLVFISNILVVNDAGNPENNGKVFLFKYGQKIFEKIKNIMTPEEALGEEPNDPFDFWNGQTFKLKIKKVGEFRNYDDSSFASPSQISKDGKKALSDEDIEVLWKTQHSLSEFTDPATYKAYEVLKDQLYKVLEIRDETVAKTAERLSMEVDNAVGKSSDDEAPFDMSDGDDADLDKLLQGL